MNTQRVIELLQDVTADLVESNATPLHCESIGYFRPCQNNENLSATYAEAKRNGSILAMKGEVFCIMPRLVDGWQLVGGVN